jgi:aminoglycoside phosphotransferase family enzyme/predicted kinase
MPGNTDVQDKVFAFLTNPATHPDVRRIDTHAASVFLEGTRALKVKRAVRFPYLDNSTLAKRKAACDEEMKINRPFAPQIYRRVVPITQSDDGSLSIDGDGVPVEFAIEMTRFDERQTIDHLAEAGEPDRDLVDAIADAIEASHAVAPLAPTEPWIKSIPTFIKDNTAAFRTAACFPASDVDGLEDASQSEFSGVRELLEQRSRQGYVRRCHGDLHLANIVLIERKPVLFDAIEFDATIASVDVLYDLAFPMMDFIRYDRHAAANTLLNRYLNRASIEHFDALAALPLFMSLRAAIRANVLLARLNQASRQDPDVLRSAHEYFELARRLIHPATPTLVAIGGLSGTGKSLLGRALAPDVMPLPGAVVLRSDVLRKQHFQVKETKRLPANAYQPQITDQIYDTLVQRASRALVQGYSVVVDAVFAREAERAAIREAALKQNIHFVGFFLVTDLATRQSRVRRREGDASDATPEIAGLQEQYDIGVIDWHIIDASGTPEQTLKQCQTRIAHREAT